MDFNYLRVLHSNHQILSTFQQAPIKLRKNFAKHSIMNWKRLIDSYHRTCFNNHHQLDFLLYAHYFCENRDVENKSN